MKSYNQIPVHIASIAVFIVCLVAALPSFCEAFVFENVLRTSPPSSSYYGGVAERRRPLQLPYQQRRRRQRQPRKFGQRSNDISVIPACSMHAVEDSLIVIGSTDIELPLGGGSSTVIISVVALALVTAAQMLISSMLDGDRGLRAFLSDGSGYNKSGFKSNRGNGGKARSEVDTRRRGGGSDPLSWLRLPKLDYVDVVGQEKETVVAVAKKDEALVVQELEELAERLRSEIQDGKKEKAEKSAAELESLMQKYGFNYKESSP